MKKLLKVAGLLLFLAQAYSVNAQFSIGPKTGINFTTVWGEDINSEYLKPHMGFQFGVATEFRLAESFGIQTELLYYQKGFRTVFDFGGETISIKQTHNYVEVPVLAKLCFLDPQAGELFITIGPSFGYGINGKIKSDDFEEGFNFEEASLARLDVGLSIGGGIQIPIADPGRLFLDFRYVIGFTKLYEGSTAVIKNRGLGIGLGYLFPLG